MENILCDGSRTLNILNLSQLIERFFCFK